MTCRFELEFAGKGYSRSCPTCGFGPCKASYEQVKLTPEQGERLGFHYVIVNPKGKPEPDKQAKWNTTGNGVPSQVLIAMTAKRDKQDDKEDRGKTYVGPGDLRHENSLGVGVARAQEAVDAAAQSNVGIKLTRVQRAKVLDWLEKYSTGRTETELNELLDELLTVLNET